ncbi:ADL296Cp [Eremothecium gossypii ATCC 10895]|uniref:GTP cyclohydrolase II n=1 Tax=Eremothecium gossypii (strain ATCC 10895 / CBS 109.51 / FGSC 9923 / NRRL Y-1056) TaxID=284811 RepID=Q75B68_EREGS|nr:ADL296Cp [Eremothecium gossypii ATCC 10895]AAS51624.1 ADL296Cp [Eremothecium gossypii ATCC 10895]
MTEYTVPEVTCVARARIPTVQGTDVFLHLYHNSIDSKEHLAIVFGENIRSRSLFRYRKDDTQQARMVRGAYVGQLYPGRTEADADRRQGLELRFDETGQLVVERATTWTREPTLVRLHSECYTGETAWSARCDCGEQFDQAGKLMAAATEGEVVGGAGHGVIVYLRQEGRGIGLGEKLKAYNLQDLGADTVQANELLNHPADARDFSLGRAILLDLGIEDIRLLTNNPDKVQQVHCPPALRCIERVPMVPLSWTQPTQGVRSRELDGYLRAKVERMGHMLQRPLVLHTSAAAELPRANTHI